MHTKVIFRLMFLLNALAPALVAAEQSTPVSVPVTLRVISIRGFTTDMAVRAPGNKRTRIVAKSSSLSKPINALAVNGTVDFFAYPPKVSNSAQRPDNEQPDPVIASFKTQPEVTEYLVLVSSITTNEETHYSIFTVPYSDATLPAGHTIAFNFTEWPLALRLGQDIATLSPRDSQVFFWPPGSDNHLDVQIGRSLDKDQWELVTSTRVNIPPQRRLFLLLTPGSIAETSSSGPVVATGSPIEMRVIYDMATSI